VFDVLKNLDCVELIAFKENEEIKIHYKGETIGLDNIGSYLSNEEYPFAKERIAGLMESERCGDFVITAKKGYEFQKGENKGAHGGLNFEDSVSFAVAHILGQKEINIDFALSVDVVRMAFEKVYNG